MAQIGTGGAAKIKKQHQTWLHLAIHSLQRFYLKSIVILRFIIQLTQMGEIRLECKIKSTNFYADAEGKLDWILLKRKR